MKNIGKLISIEGNIGSGKSTLLKLLTNKYPHVQTVDQPLQDWIDSDLLSLYYKDQNRWAFTFQTYCLFSRMRAINRISSSSSVMISQRSVQADRQVFAKLLKKKNFINETQWKLYQSYFKGFQQQLQPKPVDIFLYLRTSPETCYDRILKRARSQQGVIPLQYLKDLHQRHESWLLSQSHNTLVLDGNQNFQGSAQILQQLISQIKTGVKRKAEVNL